MDRVMLAIPAFNESATIVDVVTAAQAALPEAQLVVIDDGSADGTGELAASAGAEVLTLPFNVGVGGAMRTAFLYALQGNVDAVVQIDADGQHDAGQAPRLVAALESSSVVVGSRFLSGDRYAVPFLRRVSMRILARVLTSVTGTALTDTTSGFRAVDRRAVALFARHYPAEYLGDTVESLVLAHRAGLGIAEVPVTMRHRQGGRPSQGPLRSALYLARALLALIVALTRPSPSRDVV